MAHIKPDQLRSGFYEITGSLYGTSSFAITASHVDKAVVTASAVNDTITFTKGDGSTFPITLTSIATASYALNALSSSYALTASYASNIPATASYALNALSSSYAATASYINTLYSSNYTQSFTNQSTWVVIHNLDTLYVIVQVYDTNFDEIIPQNIDLTNNDTVTITFPTLESGTAVVSVGGALQNGGSVSSSYAFNSTSASYASTSSYVNLVAGPNITINNIGNTFEISGSGGGSVTVPGNNTEILFNSASALQASSNFKFIYSSGSLQQGSGNIASGIYSHAEGTSTKATDEGSHAEGYGSLASGRYAHAEGQQTSASWDYAHAEGILTKALNEGDHAEGYITIAQGAYSHAEGFFTTASGMGSHAEGYQTWAFLNHSHAEGYSTIASGLYSHTEGHSTSTNGIASHAEGHFTQAPGNYSHAEGWSSIASGQYSHAEGRWTTAQGDYSHTEGNLTLASAIYSHAEGRGTNAIGDTSHAEGYFTISSGSYSHAEGQNTNSSGYASHAEGYYTTSSGDWSHTEGRSTISLGQFSHAEGWGTVAQGNYQHVQGMFNISSSDMGAFILGNGINTSSRSNLIYASGSQVQITGSLIVTGSLIITGSTQGNVSTLSVSSNTASVDLTRANFFTITLPSSVTTHISASNIRPGTTSTILVTTDGTSTVTFPSNVKQPSGSFYTASAVAAKDILTFISYDSSDLYLASVKNLI